MGNWFTRSPFPFPTPTTCSGSTFIAGNHNSVIGSIRNKYIHSLHIRVAPRRRPRARPRKFKTPKLETNQTTTTSVNDSKKQIQKLHLLPEYYYMCFKILEEDTTAFKKEIMDEFKAYKTEQEKITKELQLENNQLKVTVELMQSGVKKQLDYLKRNVGRITMNKTKASIRLSPIELFNIKMGILGLSKLIGDLAPEAIKENEMKNYFGRKVAVDASMSLYQFLIAVRNEGAQLTSADGETTSHIMGFFYRTIRMVENGIKPVYVFDGKPPQMKAGELEKRHEKREEAQKALDKAEEVGDVQEVDKQARRLVKVTKSHVEEAMKLLGFMGIPFVHAPCEAEAQCAVLQKAGKVYAVATEDMDALTFGTTVLLRHMTFSEARKMPIKEFYLQKVLQALEFSMDEFIDLCILLGCDYCDSIKGIGPKRAVELIKQHRSIENILEKLDKKKYTIPENWPYKQARALFKEPEIQVAEEIELTWSVPDEEGLVAFMCGEKGFQEDRVRNGCKKLQKARQTTTQGRLDSFFKVLPSTGPSKRPTDDKKGGVDKKKGKTAGASKRGGSGGGYRRGK